MNKLPKKYDLTGSTIGEWTVIRQVPRPNGKKKSTYWECKCSCGNVSVESRYSLLNNTHKLSCGCIVKPIKKGEERKKYTRTKDKVPKSLRRLKSIWSKMKRRCNDERDDQYKNYGAKGIYVCDRWLEFERFKEDMYESYLEFEKVNGENTATIDRIDNSKPYELRNCRWATQLEQARNRSNNVKVEIDGVLYNTISEVSIAFNINYDTILQRYHRGIRGLGLVDKTNIKHTNSVGTLKNNRKHYEKMKKRRENKN